MLFAGLAWVFAGYIMCRQKSWSAVYTIDVIRDYVEVGGRTVRMCNVGLFIVEAECQFVCSEPFMALVRMCLLFMTWALSTL